MADDATSSDDSGLSDSNTDDDSNDSTDPTTYYPLDGSNSTPEMNGTGGYSTGSAMTPTATVTTYGDPQNAKIPMQKTGIPILPAELGIISIIGGFMINRIRS